ncbi:pyridoxal phosphate homeostasis protein ASCRUDRAFT_79909 [Ascoidea rubescens DSM 1968]|uniref:Pyridoxal phosphate homeostasis protein n=1 Tax=Ascoidea rubescens DSM 1968 TaxID=1344418 RepID=A0A1D2VL99_9ASCO|nr:hypothetical protein ASCRUDRAFT_79909 [Ascoidea rubescens DSM 1968]ODV62371.1 hypothetical protein ASCRUDRAFT_79909 [Ascoidea rubescens DSM 1968]
MSSSAADYPEPTPDRQVELGENYTQILKEMTQVTSASNIDSNDVHLVCVSKLKPASDIYSLYKYNNVCHFGENYVQELIEKAKLLPKDINWHFIGSLQTNKCKDLSTRIPNLYSVETIDTIKKAKKLNDTRANIPDSSTINVFIQINTSSESQKSGIVFNDLETVLELSKFIQNECPKLQLKGLMTIGSFLNSTSSNDNEINQDFQNLSDVKHSVEKALGLDFKLQLNMGMSNDFHQAIKQGSNYIRVGSNIFGQRPKKN